MSIFVSLEDAAKRLGVSTDQLIEMRSRGEIFGFRDGASWKFKPEEIERVAAELMGDILDEDPAGSSILNLEPDYKQSGSGLSSSASGSGAGQSGSDVSIEVDPESSDVRLVANSDRSLAEASSGGGLSSVDDSDLHMATSDDDDDEISLASEDGDDILSDIATASSTGSSSHLGFAEEGSDAEVSLGSDIKPSVGSDAGVSDLDLLGESDLQLAEPSDLIQGDSDPALGPASSAASSDIELADDLELDDDLVLDGGSDLAIRADSGINLTSPADSGISLEEEPLDLNASGISGLDFSAEGSDVGSDPGVGVGSGVDFKDEDFQLSPSGGLEVDDDSGSQVIDLEDSADLGPAAGVGGADGLDAFAEVADSVDTFGDASAAMAPPLVGSPEIPYSSLQVVLLLGIVLLLSFSGILMSDIVRNMWAWSGNENTLTSGFTEMLVGIFNR